MQVQPGPNLTQVINFANSVHGHSLGLTQEHTTTITSFFKSGTRETGSAFLSICSALCYRFHFWPSYFRVPFCFPAFRFSHVVTHVRTCYGTCLFKLMLRFGTLFRNFFARLLTRIGILLPKCAGFVQKNGTASFTDLPELLFGHSVAAFRSSGAAFVLETKTSEGKVSKSQNQF